MLTQAFTRSRVVCRRSFEVGGKKRVKRGETKQVHMSSQHFFFSCMSPFLNGCVGGNVS